MPCLLYFDGKLVDGFVALIATHPAVFANHAQSRRGLQTQLDFATMVCDSYDWMRLGNSPQPRENTSPTSFQVDENKIRDKATLFRRGNG